MSGSISRRPTATKTPPVFGVQLPHNSPLRTLPWHNRLHCSAASRVTNTASDSASSLDRADGNLDDGCGHRTKRSPGVHGRIRMIGLIMVSLERVRVQRLRTASQATGDAQICATRAPRCDMVERNRVGPIAKICCMLRQNKWKFRPIGRALFDRTAEIPTLFVYELVVLLGPEND